MNAADDIVDGMCEGRIPCESVGPKKTKARKHAILSASGAARWLHCTPSARLEEQFPDTGSEYAAEGTLAHSIAELKVRKKFVEPMGPRTFNTRMNKLKKDGHYSEEMQRCTDDYLDYISKVYMSYKEKPTIAVERKLDYSRYAPEGFGTGDCIIIGSDTLHVIDFKYGKGVIVEVENNPQLMLYGLGAIEIYGKFYNTPNIILTVFQPRAEGDTVKEWKISRDSLVNWGVFTVKPLADQAFKGEGEFKPSPDTCRFCRARYTCRARAKENTALEDFKGIAAPSKAESGEFPKPTLLTDSEVGEVLKKAVDLEKWAADLKEYALTATLAGKVIPGWKAVEGRSKRVFDNMDTAFKDIEAAGYDEAMLYERKPLTLAAVEKTLGKSKFAEVAGKHVVVSAGKPALVQDSDKRPPYHPHDAASDFKDVAVK